MKKLTLTIIGLASAGIVSASVVQTILPTTEPAYVSQMPVFDVSESDMDLTMVIAPQNPDMDQGIIVDLSEKSLSGLPIETFESLDLSQKDLEILKDQFDAE